MCHASLADWTMWIHAIVELAQDPDVPDPASALESLALGLSQLVPNKRPRSVEFTHQRVHDDAGKVRRAALRDAQICPSSHRCDRWPDTLPRQSLGRPSVRQGSICI